MSEDVCVGFIVVRLPGVIGMSNLETNGRRRNNESSDIRYGGVDRFPWCDIEDDYHDGKLSPSLRQLVESMKSYNDDTSGLRICRNYDVAEKLLEYSNREVRRNEIVAVHSALLEKIKGRSPERMQISWLGIDAFALGEWSILSEGVFAKPELFPEWKSPINQYVLLERQNEIGRLRAQYTMLSRKGLVEDLAPNAIVDAVRVGRVAHAGGLQLG